MKSETYNTAFKRVIEGQSGKSELEVLIKWGESEIAEWQRFIEICKENLENIKQLI